MRNKKSRYDPQSVLGRQTVMHVIIIIIVKPNPGIRVQPEYNIMVMTSEMQIDTRLQIA